MKTNFKWAIFLMAGTMLLFSSCERDEVSTEDDANLVNEVTAADIVNSDVHPRDAVTDEKVLDLIKGLEIDAGNITKGDFHLPDGTIEQRIYIGDDIVVTVDQLRAMSTIDNQQKQYRTFNLVTGNNRTIDILGYTGNDQFGLSNRGQTALQWAVNNYNRLSGVSLNFRLTYGTNVNEHVITHEIGHSIGFRHSDWFDRLSCPTSSQGNEGQGSDGSVHIPGTPTGRDLTSIMQACFSSNEDGEFNNNDITALRFMY